MRLHAEQRARLPLRLTQTRLSCGEHQRMVGGCGGGCCARSTVRRGMVAVAGPLSLLNLGHRSCSCAPRPGPHHLLRPWRNCDIPPDVCTSPLSPVGAHAHLVLGSLLARSHFWRWRVSCWRGGGGGALQATSRPGLAGRRRGPPGAPWAGRVPCGLVSGFKLRCAAGSLACGACREPARCSLRASRPRR